jgi:hypothetical protein
MKLTQILIYGSVAFGRQEKYYDDRGSRVPDWVLENDNQGNPNPNRAECNGIYNNNGRNNDDDYECQRNRESWEDSFPIEFTGADANVENSVDDLKTVINTMRTLYGDPRGRQTVEVPSKNFESNKVWDFVEKVFYRDGDLFVIPAKNGYQKLMKFNNNDNKHNLYRHTGSNEFNDAQNNLLPVDEIDQTIEEDMRYGQDFCNFLSGSTIDQTTGEWIASAPADSSLGQSVMFVPHSQAEFKRLFLQSAYTTHSGFGAPGQQYPDELESVCSSFDPTGSEGKVAASKFWLGLWRRGLTSNDTSRSQNIDNQVEFMTDDPWFLNDYRTNTGCNRRSRVENRYSIFHSNQEDYQHQNCIQSVDGESIMNDDFARTGESCWRDQRHPDRYQNFVNSEIQNVNALKGGQDVIQDDCVVAICSDRDRRVNFEMQQCNDRDHVPICRVPLVSCKNKLKCEAREDLTEYVTRTQSALNNGEAQYDAVPQLCGKVSLQSNAVDYVNGFEDTVLPIIKNKLSNVGLTWEDNLLATGRTNVYASAAITRTDFTIVVDRPQTIGLNNGAQPNSIRGQLDNGLVRLLEGTASISNVVNTVSYQFKDTSATSQQIECPCTCGCVEPHEDDIDQRTPIEASFLHFFRMANSNQNFQSSTRPPQGQNMDWNFGVIGDTNDFPVNENRFFTCDMEGLLMLNNGAVPTYTSTFKDLRQSKDVLSTTCREQQWCIVENTANFDFVECDFSNAPNHRLVANFAAHYYQPLEPPLTISDARVPWRLDDNSFAVRREINNPLYNRAQCPQRFHHMCDLKVCGECEMVVNGKCEELKCSLAELPSLTNYEIKQPKDTFSCRESVVVVCQTGYDMYVSGTTKWNRNEMTFTCNENNRSRPQLDCVSVNGQNQNCRTLECKKRCEIPTGTNILEPVNWQLEHKFPGDIMTVTCKPGFQVESNGKLYPSIPQTCNNNYKFPHTICQPINCTPIQDVSNNFPNGYCYLDNPNETLRRGSTGKCRCNKCFTMQLNSRIHPVNNNCHVQYRNIQCIGTDEGTAWNNLDFSCEQQVCSNPPLVENADLVFDVEPIVNGEPGFDDGKNTFTTDAHCGKPVFYDCKPGYLASFNVDDSAKANEKMLGTDRPFSLCSDEGTGCYSKVYGPCAAITCPPLTVGENNAWMPFYLKAGQKIYHDAVETLNSEIAAVRDFQNQVSYPQGTQALFECYEDFEAEPKQNMLAISKDLDCDFYAANPTERGTNTNNRLSYIRQQTDNNVCCRSHDEFDTTSEMVNNLVNRDNVNEGLRWKNVIACFNDKLRRVCQADGTWSDAAYECKCTNNKPVPSTDCEHYANILLKKDVRNYKKMIFF